jgi:hypothetical protein
MMLAVFPNRWLPTRRCDTIEISPREDRQYGMTIEEQCVPIRSSDRAEADRYVTHTNAWETFVHWLPFDEDELTKIGELRLALLFETKKEKKTIDV